MPGWADPALLGSWSEAPRHPGARLWLAAFQTPQMRSSICTFHCGITLVPGRGVTGPSPSDVRVLETSLSPQVAASPPLQLVPLLLAHPAKSQGRGDLLHPSPSLSQAALTLRLWSLSSARQGWSRPPPLRRAVVGMVLCPEAVPLCWGPPMTRAGAGCRGMKHLSLQVSCARSITKRVACLEATV